jgi:phosphoribosylanthranilate isomerase
VVPEIKFCGMTRAEDIDAAAAIGARYVGVIFAGGPRVLTSERARDVLHAAPRSVSRVGVFGDAAPDVIADVARVCALDVVQLHDDPRVHDVLRTRERFDGEVWATVRVRGRSLPAGAVDLFRAADAVVLDAYSPVSLGGTGLRLPWAELADVVAAVRPGGRLVLAGGLRPDNVREAVRAMCPDVVDVSSGVESAPGIKDHGRLRAFRDAVVQDRARI